MSEERRRDPRFEKTLSFQIQNGGAGRLAAESINISSRGLYCRAPEPVPVMSKLNISLNLPFPGGKSELLECEGVVVRAEKDADGSSRIAIYFLNFNAAKADILNRYLASAG